MTPGADPPNRRARSGTRPSPRQRLDTAAHLANRRREAARARVIRRRRALVGLCTVVVVAGIVAACNAVTDSKPGTSGTTGGSSTSSTDSTTTTTTLPSAFGVGIYTFKNWVEKDATTETPAGGVEPGRVLTTEVRYPVLDGSSSGEEADATPARTGAPYPVIVFAHGFDLEPSDYAGLLDSWVRAGFVVVSPIFPDENATTVNDDGGPDTLAGHNLENDVYKEPGDIYWVLRQLDEGTQAWEVKLRGVMNFDDIALAGQSDGANVVAALAYTSQLHHIFGLLPSAPKAVAVLSGQAWDDDYRASATSPALLQVQSDADGCNAPYLATDLYAQLQGGLATKWFDVLLGADHLQPYTEATSWATVVDNVTTKFFELELHWRTSETSAADVVAAGTVSGVSAMTTTVSDATIPSVTPIGGCWGS